MSRFYFAEIRKVLELLNVVYGKTAGDFVLEPKINKMFI